MFFNKIKTHRDTALIELPGNINLAIACDSAGGIGDKERDVVKVSPYILGRFTSRVALMEIISINAEPVALSVCIASEPHPTGDLILDGIKSELKEINKENLPITISTEKNIHTVQTGLGVTCVGVYERENLLAGRVKRGNKIYVVGIPKVGNEVKLEDNDLFDLKTLIKLKNSKEVNEIIPVGSKGILGELENFSLNTLLNYRLFSSLTIDIKKSAGPCTCAIVFAENDLSLDLSISVHLIGEVV